MEATIEYKGVELLVQGHYSPPERMSMYDSNLEGYSGCNAEFECFAVYIDDVAVFDLFTPKQLSEIEELAILKIENK